MHPATSQYVIGVVFLGTGVLHFLKPAAFISIMPHYIPYHKALVFITGTAEILGGLGVMIPLTQRWAAWGLIILLIAVFPANIHMTVQAFRYQGWQSFYTAMTVLRLPLQFLLMYWVYWACIQH